MITLSYPYTTPTSTLSLPNPRAGNSKQLQGKISYKKTMSGDLHTTIGGSINTKLILVFELLKNTEVDGLVTFIKLVRSNEFKYVDHESITHKCKFPLANFSYSWSGRYGRLFQLELLEVS